MFFLMIVCFSWTLQASEGSCLKFVDTNQSEAITKVSFCFGGTRSEIRTLEVIHLNGQRQVIESAANHIKPWVEGSELYQIQTDQYYLEISTFDMSLMIYDEVNEEGSFLDGER